MPVPPTTCNRCGDVVEEGADPKDELAELNALLERLKLKRCALRRKVNRFRSPIVRQLPAEVTSIIFEFCLPDFTDHPLSPDIKEDRSIPLSLGAICSYWRGIAWSTPSLWSSLVIRDPSKHNPHISTGIAQEWLARSGGLPLSIHILSTFNNKTVLALIDIINQYSNRWFNLDLYIPDSYYQRFHSSDNQAVIHAPILKSIRFHRPTHASESGLNFQLASCPRLERASLSYFPMDGSKIQWDNLTHLTLHSMFFADTFRILRKCPRLVFCEVSDFCSHHREQRIGRPVLSSIRSLKLLIAHFVQFFNNLIAPHLEEFNIQDPRYYVPIPRIEAVTSFLSRSACSLRSLSMMFTVAPQYFEGFMNLLQSMPSLTTLSLLSTTALLITTPEEYHPRNILQLVSKVLSSQSTSHQQGFLPNLEILEYTGGLYLHSGNYDDLYPLPPTDNAGRGPLHLLKLNLHGTFRIPENMISYISSLAERGVTVNVLSSSEDILQSSIDYYRSREDLLCRDWTDSLDLSLFS